MAEDRIVRAALIIIGNEILSGRTHDKNLQHLAKVLNEVGVVLAEARVVPDVEAMIVEAVNALRARYDYVFTTGGIGPTHDDITAACVAKAFGRELTRHPEAYRLLVAHYERTGRELNEARLRMANTPEGASLIHNPVSTAPGFRVENVFVMAGVPQIMHAMLDGLKDTLEGGSPVHSRAVTSGLPEGRMAVGLGALQARFDDIDIGSYPYYGPTGNATTIVLRHRDIARLDAAAAEVAALVRELGGTPEFRDPSVQNGSGQDGCEHK